MTDLCTCLIVPYPYIERITQNTPTIMILLTFACTFRLCILGRYMYYRYPNHAQSGKLSAPCSQTVYDTQFLFKQSIEKNPVLLTCASFLVLNIVVGFFVYIAENGAIYCWQRAHPSEMSMHRTMTISDSIWLVVCSSSTIGFGHIVPKSHAARILMFFAIVIGALINAILFTLAVKFSQFSPQELSVFHFLTRAHHLQERKHRSAKVIQSSFFAYRAIRESVTWIPASINGFYYRRLLPVRRLHIT